MGGESLAHIANDDLWHTRFLRERERIVVALGGIIGGGIIEEIAHVGVTSVPDLAGQPYIDLAACVWPFPIEKQKRQALRSLGYQPLSEDDPPAVQRFRHTSGEFQLEVVEAGSSQWTDYLVVREFLRHDADARRAFSSRTQEWVTTPDVQQAKKQVFAHLLPDARRWWIEHVQFTPLCLATEELRDFSTPWYFCAGWALDLYRGHVERVHDDIDIIISRADQILLYDHMTAHGWTMLSPYEGKLPLWPRHTRLEPPRHQAHALRDGAFLDFLLTDIENGVWRYRREPSIIRTVERMSLRTAEGLPFLAPELVLLFKSKNTSGKERSKDQADFESTLDLLEPERRLWLRWALMAIEPTHPWLERL